jgi:hypothetical protein
LSRSLIWNPLSISLTHCLHVLHTLQVIVYIAQRTFKNNAAMGKRRLFYCLSHHFTSLWVARPQNILEFPHYLQFLCCEMQLSIWTVLTLIFMFASFTLFYVATLYFLTLWFKSNRPEGALCWKPIGPKGH